LAKESKALKKQNIALVKCFPAIQINVVSGHADKTNKEYRDKNLSGHYIMVDIVNERPAYKRDEKDEIFGDEMYLWYNGRWRISRGKDFKARNEKCYMFIQTSETEVKKLGNNWIEAYSDDVGFKETAIVTIT